MPLASTTTKKSSPQRSITMLDMEQKSLYSAKQSRFSTSKLIQNLGSGNYGVQFNFVGDLRTAHGRD